MIFSTEDGTIVGFNPEVDHNEGMIEADLSQSGAVFKTLTAGTVNGANYLYASDFHNGTVDVFDKNFQLVHLRTDQFTDPSIPAGFAPFGLKNVNGTLFVTYAKQDDARHDDVAGVGNGFIDEFTLSGQLITRFASQGLLNSPHGIAVAPDNFGRFSNALLVGNFGDSKVNAFDLKTGAVPRPAHRRPRPPPDPQRRVQERATPRASGGSRSATGTAARPPTPSSSPRASTTRTTGCSAR